MAAQLHECSSCPPCCRQRSSSTCSARCPPRNPHEYAPQAALPSNFPRSLTNTSVKVRHRCQALNRLARAPPRTTASMITDRDLFSLAIFLGAASMILIVVYHFLEVNAVPEAAAAKKAN